MMWRIMIMLAVLVNVFEAGVPLPRKVVLNADNLEILRLDIMSAEVRISNNVKDQADRVEAALARHGAKRSHCTLIKCIHNQVLFEISFTSLWLQLGRTSSSFVTLLSPQPLLFS